MVIANLKDGTTQAYDLLEEDQFDQLDQLIQAGAITALSLHNSHTQHTLPLPKRFTPAPVFGVELLTNNHDKPVGERIFAQAENVRVSLTLTYTSKLVRCDLVKTGKMRYNPHERKVRR